MLGLDGSRGSAAWFSALLALGVNTAVSLYNLNVLFENDAHVARSRQVLTELNLLLSDVKDAETGQRGFLITGDESYLQPYWSALESMGARRQRLQTLTADNPQRQESLKRTELLIEDKLHELDRTIAAYREAGGAAARQIVLTNVGKEKMDAIRASMDSMIERENALLVARANNSRAKYRATTITTVVGGLLTFGMTGAAFVLIRREMAQRKRVEQDLLQSERDLRAKADDLAAAQKAIMSDLTSRLQNEQALRESQARFHSLAESMPQFVFVARFDGFIEYFNQRWYEYTGLNSQQSIGFRWSTPLHPDDKQKSELIWKLATDMGQSFETEYRIRRSDGAYRWFLGRALPQRNEYGRVVNWFGTCTDIDDRKKDIDERLRQAQLLEELVRERTAALSQANTALSEEIEVRKTAEENEREAAEELRRSNRELEQFAYVASHDLQEPLRKIQAFSDRLHKKFSGQLGDQGQEYTDRITMSATRMRNLINDLLSFSRVATHARPFVSVDLAEVVRDTLLDLDERVSQTGATVDVGPLPRIDGDPTQMRQLFQNLIANALKFHKPDVAPVVTIRSRVETAPALSPERAPQDVCHVEIADNGIGFDERYANRIFQIFQRLHGRSEYEGTGIGLAICRKIVERHSGQISATSSPGQGSTFVVVLPVHQGDPGQTDSEAG